jgi:hypothetical protein
VDFIVGLLVGFAVLAAVAIAAYVVLRRLFERAANRVADDLGKVLTELSTRAVATPAGQRAAGAARASSGVTHMGAYAAAEGISEEAARRDFAQSIERIARIMDSAVRIPIIGPVGLDAALGLFPVAGDTASAAVSVLLIARSLKYGVPQEIIAKMLGNVLLDFLLGALPIAGDLADMWFRANERNVRLLREFLQDSRGPGTPF